MCFQEIYGKLEEPDGLSGLMKLRSGGLSLQDQVLAAEKTGSWTEAAALYEQALKQDSKQDTGIGLSSAQYGHLQCLLQMGHLQTMLAQVDGWMKTADGESSLLLKLPRPLFEGMLLILKAN